MDQNTKDSFSRSLRWLGKGALYFCLLLVGGIITATNWDDWIAHSKTVDLYMAPDWLPGESRTCIAFQDEKAMMTSIDCPVGDYTEKPHTMEIRFFGKVSRPELLKDHSSETHFEWTCTRREGGFTCKSIN
jgi:hypothetical protein